MRKLSQLLGDLRGKTVGVWGLTYKPGTDTLRRSASVELCRRLIGSGAVVRAHDPAVKALPADLTGVMTLAVSPAAAAEGADALVIATEWPDYLAVAAGPVAAGMRHPVVIDSNRFLAKSFGSETGIRYATVGKPL